MAISIPIAKNEAIELEDPSRFLDLSGWLYQLDKRFRLNACSVEDKFSRLNAENIKLNPVSDYLYNFLIKKYDEGLSFQEICKSQKLQADENTSPAVRERYPFDTSTVKSIAAESIILAAGELNDLKNYGTALNFSCVNARYTGKFEVKWGNKD